MSEMLQWAMVVWVLSSQNTQEEQTLRSVVKVNELGADTNHKLVSAVSRIGETLVR